jgi:4-hydroxybenzoate polyprenyltransferase
MIKYLKLIRFHNLLVIAATMFSMRYLLIQPILDYYGYQQISSNSNFSILVIAVLLVTAGASVINDYFDRKSDLLNRPENVIIGTDIHRRFAIILHSVLSLFGVILGFWLGKQIYHFWIGFVFILVTVAFYLYSATYKRKLIIGNMIISLLIAGIPLLPFALEYLSAINVYAHFLPVKMYHHLFMLSLGFAFAGFFINLAREITKDIIDFRGDYQSGSKTLPIVMGKSAAKTIISILFFLITSVLILVWFVYLNRLSIIQYPIPTLAYITLTLVSPALVLSLHVLRMKHKQEFLKMCFIIKGMMFFGVLFSFVIYLNLIF